jgi:hypothetical protein
MKSGNKFFCEISSTPGLFAALLVPGEAQTPKAGRRGIHRGIDSIGNAGRFCQTENLSL